MVGLARSGSPVCLKMMDGVGTGRGRSKCSRTHPKSPKATYLYGPDLKEGHPKTVATILRTFLYFPKQDNGCIKPRKATQTHVIVLVLFGAACSL